MSFDEYALANYTDRSNFEIPRGFSDASKMNSVDGDRQDSLFSPLRAEFFSEATIVFGGITDAFAAIELLDSHGPTPAIVIAGSTAVMGLAAVVRQHARQAIEKIL